MFAHRRDQGLGRGKKSYAYWCEAAPRSLFVFVHGFGGKAQTTWAAFPDLFPVHDKCKHSDIVFLGYDSLWDTPGSNADLIYRLITDLVDSPSTVIPPSLIRELHRETGWKYESINVVAHSLGAILARRALLRAYDEKKPWAKLTRLFFFAPAHRGARSAKHLIETLATLELGFEMVRFSIGKAVSSLGLYASPALEALLPKSQMLKDLRKDTKAAIAIGNKNVVAVKTIFGSRERVVYEGQFIPDEHVETIGYHRKNHFSVCKPKRSSFTKPLDDVLEVMC